jgi:cellulose synthase/poly-beta-1,6-N-acetylglucosamine synthase-like glycosyltransferase
VLARAGAGISASQTAYLLVLLGAALLGKRRERPRSDDSLGLVVLIPAHDEARQIAGTLKSVLASDYPPERRKVLVLADNCSDRTAEVARSEGVEVWERDDPAQRGKGFALAWAFDRLSEDVSVAGVCVVDADCRISSNLLSAVAARLGAGAEAVQVPYLVSNPEESQKSALRWAGFALFNVVRPLGRDQLGMSCGLFGTGLAMSRGLIRRSPWRAHSYAEDREQHMRWVLDGARVVFAPEAEVNSPATGSGTGVRARESRWESGRLRLAMTLTPSLLARAVRNREVRALDAALEPMLMPQSLLAASGLAGVGAAVLARDRLSRRLALMAVLGQSAYVIGGLVVTRAPRSVWAALLTAPRFVAERLGLFGRLLTTGGPTEWERTPRDREQ